MATDRNPYDEGLDQNPANYTPLTPLSCIAWSARVCPKRLAAIHGERRFTRAETNARSRRLSQGFGGEYNRAHSFRLSRRSRARAL
jgi:fatty-acyl-CoA synthase